jgi:hypothetical protein
MRIPIKVTTSIKITIFVDLGRVFFSFFLNQNFISKTTTRELKNNHTRPFIVFLISMKNDISLRILLVFCFFVNDEIFFSLLINEISNEA